MVAGVETDNVFTDFSRIAKETNDSNITSRIDVLQKRYEFYDDDRINKLYPQFDQWHRWLTHPNRIKQHVKLKSALEALHGLNAIPLSQDEQQAKDIILARVHSILTCLEESQLRLLQKLQHDHRNADELAKQHIDERKAYMKMLAKFDNDKLKMANPDDPIPAWKAFIASDKGFKIRLSSKLDVMRNVAAGMGFTSRLLHIFVLAMHVLHSVASVLSTVPIVSSIISGSAMVIGAIQAWQKNKSTQKKAFATIMAVIGIGAIISVGLATVATGGIVAGLITLGVVQNQIRPWWKEVTAIRELNKRSNESKERIVKLRGEAPIIDLTLLEKQVILQDLEKRYLDANSETISTLDAIKAEVIAGNLKSIQENYPDITMSDFLISINEKQLLKTGSDLEVIRENEREKRYVMLNGLLAITGAILICIPTPPTIFLGASLLLLNSVIDIGMRFHVVDRVKSWWNKTDAVSVPSEPMTDSTKSTPDLNQKYAPVNDHKFNSSTVAEIKWFYENKIAENIKQTPAPVESAKPVEVMKSETANERKFESDTTPDIKPRP